MLFEVLTRVLIVALAMVLVALPIVVGPKRLRETARDLPNRLVAVAPIAVILTVVLLFNRYARPRLPGWSRQYGVRVSDWVYQIEGDFILVFQSVASTELTWYFSFIYVYGYVFLLAFPPLAYLALADTRPLRRLLTAYSLNYAIGVVFYLFVLMYGPRNHVIAPELTTVLYDFGPQYQHLTREVNHNTNVFPSLHTSLSATIAIFAIRTRREYPLWTPVAVVLATSVAISTMYLGIHWGIDVLAGVVLAIVCVALADRLVGRWSLSASVDWWPDRVFDVASRARSAVPRSHHGDSNRRPKQADGGRHVESQNGEGSDPGSPPKNDDGNGVT